MDGKDGLRIAYSKKLSKNTLDGPGWKEGRVGGLTAIKKKLGY